MTTVGPDQFRLGFIKSVKTRLDQFCDLATQCHPSHLSCEPFPLPGQGGPIQCGHFNLCVIIQFRHLNPERWVIRIPFPDQHSWSAEKMTSEIATMTYVAAKTNIPLPRVYDYSLSRDNLINSPYMIMDYMEGRRLRDLIRKHKMPSSKSQIEKAHLQVANIYLQLRQLEFPAIGALGPIQWLNKSLTSYSPAEIGVSGRPLTLDMALQSTSKGYHPGGILEPKTTFQSNRAFVDALAKLSANRFRRLSVLDPNQKQIPLPPFAQYIQETFHKFAAKELCQSNGPYVLMHGDLMLHDGNILFDEDFNLTAVIDWEWSFVAPVQFLVPPVWLSGSGIMFAFLDQGFKKQVQSFRGQVEMLERTAGQLSLLNSPWSSTADVWGIALIAALLHPDNIDFAFMEILFWHIYGVEKSDENIEKRGNIIKSLIEDAGKSTGIEDYLIREFSLKSRLWRS
ncbi:hypothetical protein AU210_016460 [Fusarium oxysporum f. sp. radicis-cucumerinum]|uniref:Aminoglycoside phosphotransferase domain-containing protein n=1 Tax=Fusarium oxysporum f. sp. radicis-cucumerinum TaxID=327505 RepID=A0A2H3FJW2_FUSOX|nr:hypothetical protein AU210_016720 [Fusarium oxysporum f. sp. radicis-cucumerinum]PCD21498.1 hypothetical protein AU210_016460 [Fusarium oxysporum f. sp. radicis-cucumerinum]